MKYNDLISITCAKQLNSMICFEQFHIINTVIETKVEWGGGKVFGGDQCTYGEIQVEFLSRECRPHIHKTSQSHRKIHI